MHLAFHEMITRYTFQNRTFLKKLCTPLENLGIDTFWVHSISNDGQFAYLGSRGHMAEFFCEHELYKGHPLIRHPSCIAEGVFYQCTESADQDYLNTQGFITQKFNLEQIITIIKHNSEKMLGYSFGTTLENVNLPTVILNHQSVLNKFIKYFETECEHILSSLSERPVAIAELCGEKFYSPSPFNQTIKKKQDFSFEKMFPNCYAALSPREHECIRWLLRGRTAPEIAHKLGLSKRTVEHYLENVKNKSGCCTKSELFDRFYHLFPR